MIEEHRSNICQIYQKAGPSSGTFKKEDKCVTFFPAGLTECNGLTRTDILTLLQRCRSINKPYASDLVPAVVALFETAVV